MCAVLAYLPPEYMKGWLIIQEKTPANNTFLNFFAILLIRGFRITQIKVWNFILLWAGTWH